MVKLEAIKVVCVMQVVVMAMAQSCATFSARSLSLRHPPRSSRSPSSRCSLVHLLLFLPSTSLNNPPLSSTWKLLPLPDFHQSPPQLTDFFHSLSTQQLHPPSILHSSFLLHHLQTWTDNMTKSQEPVLSPCKSEDFTSVTFYPDLTKVQPSVSWLLMIK